MSYTPNLKMNEERLARVASMKEAILKSAITAAEATQANDGQLHVKVSSPVWLSMKLLVKSSSET